jgi:hypothetical protein
VLCKCKLARESPGSVNRRARSAQDARSRRVIPYKRCEQKAWWKALTRRDFERGNGKSPAEAGLFAGSILRYCFFGTVLPLPASCRYPTWMGWSNKAMQYVAVRGKVYPRSPRRLPRSKESVALPKEQQFRAASE